MEPSVAIYFIQNCTIIVMTCGIRPIVKCQVLIHYIKSTSRFILGNVSPRVAKNSLLCGNQPTNISPEIAWVLYIFLGNSLKKLKILGGKMNHFLPMKFVYCRTNI